MSKRILHPEIDGDSDFFYKKCEIGNLYDKWLNIFKDNNIVFLFDPCILKFNSYKYGYTPFTYKFNFNIRPTLQDCNDNTIYYTLTDDDYIVFAKLFLIDGWEEELIYTFSARETKNINKNYSSNFGEICYHTKTWVDYICIQDSRIILQFRFDEYLKSVELRKEKLQKIQEYVL